MPQIIETIDVDVPVRAAYDQWTQFEEFPRFLEHVESITQTTPTLTAWKINIGGQIREFEAEITEQHPDERVAWTSTGGEEVHAGVVTFHKLDEAKTRVTLQLDWEAKGLLEKLASATGVATHAIKDDMGHFKEYIESKGSPDGAWRGDVQA
ncbi:SRPBCC family protein [Homoserinibacter sp. YIM 151385]|uniref:SRPBCC family protein n=1 Tax=Homoserinibacter sp. YIM 151385 TaxID=2985506 RepID=UPI0022F14295|nr:SRPBCC family protein [Homoserinibacter sp. YIM 151385]WBU39362.1 SRPBCC family protein [Homoserinibacter sp. YIM 151385]